jgi:DMSO reductase family type II enzyme chaperone
MDAKANSNKTNDNKAPQELSPIAKRSFLYGVFAESFGYPKDELLQAISSGALKDRLCELLTDLYPEIVEDVDWAALSDVGDKEDSLAAEYTRLFDVGVSGPPCALDGGIYHGPQMKNMEEVVRFYNHFGLTMTAAMNEMPDHLTIELEFLHFLSYGEDELNKNSDDVADYQRGQRDFIARHPGRWIPLMREKLEQAEPRPFFSVLVQLLNDFIAAELSRLEVIHGRASTAPRGCLPYIEVKL